jgi:hypothetical protein
MDMFKNLVNIFQTKIVHKGNNVHTIRNKSTRFQFNFIHYTNTPYKSSYDLKKEK